MFLYRIHTKSFCDPDEHWYEEFMSKHACPECGGIYPDVRKRGVDVYLEGRPDISAVNVVDPDICIARCDFLELFASYTNRYLNFGNVFTSNGKMLKQYATFVGEKRLILRGSEKSKIHQCGKCVRIRYCPIYPWYVLKDSLFDQSLYEAWPINGLIITEELKNTIEKGKWKGIYITKLPVVDEPRDGHVIPPDAIYPKRITSYEKHIKDS